MVSLKRRQRPWQTAPAECEGDQHAGGRAQQRQQEALDQHRLHDARPAGAERRSNRELVLARRRSREQQTGDIDRTDQQHQREQDQEDHRKNPEPDRRAPELHRVGGEYLRGTTQTIVHLGIVALQPRPQGCRRGPCSLRGYAGSEPCEDAQSRASTIVQRRQRQRAHRHVCAGCHEAGHRPMVLRKHADDLEGLAVENHRLADRARVGAEACVPVGMIEHDDARRMLRSSVVRGEGAVQAGHARRDLRRSCPSRSARPAARPRRRPGGSCRRS